jgi:ABC-type antimicrobial peptide transport system permease subunit
MHTYVYDKPNFDTVLNKLVSQIGLSEQIEFTSPIMTNMEASSVIEFMLNNVLATVIFFICLLSYILVNSLMQTDVEERKYEFGVLRTLGLRNRSLVTLISI